jgi:hypothetical protein
VPELNGLCGIADYRAASGPPVIKHLVVAIKPIDLASEARRALGDGQPDSGA